MLEADGAVFGQGDDAADERGGHGALVKDVGDVLVGDSEFLRDGAVCPVRRLEVGAGLGDPGDGLEVGIGHGDFDCVPGMGVVHGPVFNANDQFRVNGLEIALTRT